jgi:putative sugar O-methyltransferase
MNSISDTDNYKSICINAAENDEIFKNFKSNYHYNGILEHVNKEQGQLYLNYIEKNFPNFVDYLDKFKKNDLYGGSKLSNYNIGYISPSTLRYIKVFSDLNKLFGDLSEKKIIEIGVGYGGQCLIINQIFSPKEYALLDLNEALMLSEKYLKINEVSHKIIKIEELENLEEEYDLVISNYAYSELDKSLQDLYYEKIIKNSKNGYFTLNFISDIFKIESYNKEDLLKKFSDKNFKLLEENPNTYEDNIILYF